MADLPLAARNKLLDEVRAKLGDGRLDRIEPRHALAGRLLLACERGEAACDVTLTPGADPKIQALTFVSA